MSLRHILGSSPRDKMSMHDDLIRPYVLLVLVVM